MIQHSFKEGEQLVARMLYSCMSLCHETLVANGDSSGILRGTMSDIYRSLV